MCFAILYFANSFNFNIVLCLLSLSFKKFESTESLIALSVRFPALLEVTFKTAFILEFV